MTTTLRSQLTSRSTGITAILGGRSAGTRTSWPDPNLSVGRYIGKVGKELCWEARGPARDAFHVLAPKIKELIERSVEPVTTWVTWGLYMLGKAPSNASPTLLFCCDVAAHRKEVRNAVKDSGLLDEYPGIKTGHMPRPPDFDQLVALADSLAAEAPQSEPRIYAVQGDSPYGMQLLIKRDMYEDNASAAMMEPVLATVGGVLEIYDKLYFTTVAHVLNLPVELDEAPDYAGIDDEEIEIDGDSDEEGEFVKQNEKIGLVDQGSSQSRCIASIEDNAAIQRSTIESTPSAGLDSELQGTISPETTPRHIVRGDSLKVCLSSLDDPASSLDYALIEAGSFYKLSKASLYYHANLKVEQIALDGPRDVQIISQTSRGLLKGALSGTPLFTRVENGREFQEVYKAMFDFPLQIGDCGSWITDAENGELYGHIVAGSPGTGAAMVVPIASIFNDIEDRTGDRPRFPHDVQGPRIIMSDTEEKKLKLSGSAAEVVNSLKSRKPSQWDVEFSQELTVRFQQLMKEDLKRNLQKSLEMRPHFSGQHSRQAQHDGQSDEHPPAYSEEPSGHSGKARVASRPIKKLPMFPTAPQSNDLEAVKFRNLLLSLSKAPMKYENPGLLDEVLQQLPLTKLYEEAEEESSILQAQALSLGEGRSPEWDYHDCVIRALLRWFKREFFTWVSNPFCPVCHSPTVGMGTSAPTPEEAAGGALRVEIYQCSENNCRAYERFARYSDPWLLFRTRRGRVGEWVNCFSMLCRAIGARTRWVWSSEDHVWTEVYSKHRRRWIHVDPCEEAFDNPRLYAEGKSRAIAPIACYCQANATGLGWGKRFAYIIAFSIDGATDVTRRYVRKAYHSLPRERCSESSLLHIVDEIKKLRRANMNESQCNRLRLEDGWEQLELNWYIVDAVMKDFLEVNVETARRQADKIVSASGDTEKVGTRGTFWYPGRGEIIVKASRENQEQNIQAGSKRTGAYGDSTGHDTSNASPGN